MFANVIVFLSTSHICVGFHYQISFRDQKYHKALSRASQMTLIHQVILVVAIKESLQDFEMAFPKLEYL